jgi:NADPH:quinone reductase-like Zn-dependent oxidoreductase
LKPWQVAAREALEEVGFEGSRRTRLCRKPETLSHVEAAAFALTALTALVSIEDTIKLKRDETILIHGGAGGVASYAVELAKHDGSTTAKRSNSHYFFF